MEFESASATRLDFYTSREGKSVKIPSRKNWPAVAFLAFWLTGWTVGGFVAWESFAETWSNPDEFSFFLLAWLGGWALGWVFASYTLLWMLFGYETITIGNGAFISSWRALFLGKRKNYQLSEVKRLRWAEIKSNSQDVTNTVGATSGMLECNYGPKTIAIAKGIDHGEAEYLIDALNNAASPYDLVGKSAGRE